MSDKGPLRIAIAPIGKREISESFEDQAAAEALAMDRRRQYRVDAAELGTIIVQMSLDDRSFQAELVDATAEGVGLALPDSDSPQLTMGRRVDLTFQSGPARTFDARADLKFTKVEDGVRYYGFSFVDALAVQKNLGGDLTAVFNRRRTPRVAPDPTALPLQVELGLIIDDAPLPMVVPVDLSLRGMGLVAPESVANALRGHEGLEIKIHLPDGPDAVVVRGTLRNSNPTPGGVRIGIEFDRDTSGGSNRTNLDDYIEERLKDKNG